MAARAEIINTTIIVVIGLVVMAALIFVFDWVSGDAVDFDLRLMSDTLQGSERQHRSQNRGRGRSG